MHHENIVHIHFNCKERMKFEGKWISHKFLLSELTQNYKDIFSCSFTVPSSKSSAMSTQHEESVETRKVYSDAGSKGHERRIAQHRRQNQEE